MSDPAFTVQVATQVISIVSDCDLARTIQGSGIGNISAPRIPDQDDALTTICRLPVASVKMLKIILCPRRIENKPSDRRESGKEGVGRRE
jgi:hypothetical protein